ncbi:single-stranded DNA-binding protein [Streptococcus pneumoniae]|nr:single-stranded DNA-binding protein [Streptococcus pneumoniae]
MMNRVVLIGDEQGKRIYRTEVVIESITFLERRREGAS